MLGVCQNRFERRLSAKILNLLPIIHCLWQKVELFLPKKWTIAAAINFFSIVVELFLSGGKWLLILSSGLFFFFRFNARHPSNLMLDRLSGKIIHIDFGDCFEVAMTREKFPEKIPFRLTRMLINAMEVRGTQKNNYELSEIWSLLISLMAAF